MNTLHFVIELCDGFLKFEHPRPCLHSIRNGNSSEAKSCTVSDKIITLVFRIESICLPLGIYCIAVQPEQGITSSPANVHVSALRILTPLSDRAAEVLPLGSDTTR
jgi:hypothetical protein